MVQQCRFRHNDTYTTGWVKRTIRVGQRVRFERDDRLWDVIEVGRPMEDDAVKRGWNNNI